MNTNFDPEYFKIAEKRILIEYKDRLARFGYEYMEVAYEYISH